MRINPAFLLQDLPSLRNIIPPGYHIKAKTVRDIYGGDASDSEVDTLVVMQGERIVFSYCVVALCFNEVPERIRLTAAEYGIRARFRRYRKP